MYPNGSTLDQIIKFPVVIFDEVTSAIQSQSINKTSEDANEASDPNYEFITCPENLTQDDLDYNSKIKKPFIRLVKPSGQFRLQFDKNRIREGACRRLYDYWDGQAGESLIFDGLEQVIGQIKDGQPLKGLSVYVQASEMTDTGNLKFSYSVVKVSEDSIDFQLNFEKPDEVSINFDPERLIIKLKDFRDEQDRLINEEFELSVSLPNQLDPNIAVTIEEIA